MKIVEQQIAGRSAGKHDISNGKCILGAKEINELSNPRSQNQTGNHATSGNLSNRIDRTAKVFNESSVMRDYSIGHHESDLSEEHHGERRCV